MSLFGNKGQRIYNEPLSFRVNWSLKALVVRV